MPNDYVYPKLFLNGGIRCIEILVTTVALILMYIVQVNREWKKAAELMPTVLMNL